MAVRLAEETLRGFRRFSLFNSPYAAHRTGCAIDLYPGRDRLPSPVAGEVLATRTVDVRSRPYAADTDTLLLIDTGEYVARLLHVDPVVEPGDGVTVGEDVGRLIRSGYFAPWVSRHVHLDFRPPEADPWRARGSVPIAVDVAMEGLAWDGTGRVVERAPSYVVLDAPAHPAPGERFVGVAADGGGVLDGGVVHYEGGGVFGATGTSVSLLGAELGPVQPTDRDGLVTVDWSDVRVLVNDEPARGLSCALVRDGTFGAKLVEPTADLAIGDEVRVTIET